MNVPAHDWELERSLLAGVLLDCAQFPELLHAVTADDFARPNHAHLWTYLRRVYEQDRAFDVTTILGGPPKEVEELGGAAYLASLPGAVRSVDHLEVYARKIHELATLRRLQAALHRGLEAVSERDQTVEELFSSVIREVLDAAGGVGGEDWRAAFELAEEEVEAMRLRGRGEDQRPPVPTFLPELDEWTRGGFRPGQLVIVAARPAMGKTVVGLLTALAASRRGVPTGLVTLEMSGGELMQRALARLARVPLGAIDGQNPHPEDIDRAGRAAAGLRSAPLWISDRPGVSLDTLIGRTRALGRKTGRVGLLVVDYLQLMDTARERGVSREQEVARVSRGLKNLARAEGLVVVALAQVSRQVDNRGINDRRPGMHDLRESGALEQDADLILSPYRHEVYEPGNPEHAGKCEILVLKQRKGKTGVIPCEWKGDFTSIETEWARREWSRDAYEDRQGRASGEYY